jgi:YVTN family beta-propeller protein
MTILLKVIPGSSDPEEFNLSKDGKLLYISNEDVAAVSVAEVATGRIIQSLPVGEEPEGVTTSPDGAFVYVTSENDGTIAVIDTAALQFTKTISVGLRPRDVGFTPDGTKAYVTFMPPMALPVMFPSSTSSHNALSGKSKSANGPGV